MKYRITINSSVHSFDFAVPDIKHVWVALARYKYVSDLLNWQFEALMNQMFTELMYSPTDSIMNFYGGYQIQLQCFGK
jgi:hypothetical protein